MINLKYAPVVIFVYNRAAHFEQTFKALSACKEAKETELYIYSDGPKNEKANDAVQKVRESVFKAAKSDKFYRVHVIESIENKGLARSIINGVTDVINQCGQVIVIEDDCVVSPCFLHYMNKALEYYHSDKTIGSVAGYVPSIVLPDDYRADVFVAWRSCSWSWATWADRWEGVDWKMEYISDFYHNPALVKKLNLNGSDRFLRLYRQTKGNGSSWSVRFGAHLVRHNWLTVYPRYSYTQNIGCDRSGVHSKTEDAEKMQVDLSKAIPDPELLQLKVDKRIQRIMKRFYSGGLISDIKRVTATRAVIVKERRGRKK